MIFCFYCMYISISVFLRYFVFLTVYSCKRYVFVGLRLQREDRKSASPNNILKNNRSFSNTVLGPKKNKYDCIIIDSTDPVGQAKILYSKNFIKLCNASLIKGGTLIQQSGSPINDMKSLIKPLAKKYNDIGMKKIILSSFPMPLYPSGTWCFISAKRAQLAPRSLRICLLLLWVN